VGLNSESWGYIESMYPRGVFGLLSKTQDEVLDFFEKLAWGTYEFEQGRGTLGYPNHARYDFHANLHHLDHFMNSFDLSYSYVPHVLCD